MIGHYDRVQNLGQKIRLIGRKIRYIYLCMPTNGFFTRCVVAVKNWFGTNEVTFFSCIRFECNCILLLHSSTNVTWLPCFWPTMISSGKKRSPCSTAHMRWKP